MKYITIFLAFIIYVHSGISQTLPSSRSVEWKQAGINGVLEEPSIVVNFPDPASNLGGTPSNEEVFSDILSDLKGQAAVVYFPSGTYHFSSTLHLNSNIILRGASMDSTVLVFDMNEEKHLISARGKALEDTTFLISNVQKDQLTIQVEKPELFQKQDYIHILEEDSALITSSWAKYSTGQINQIEKIIGDTLFLTSPVRRGFSVNNKAFAVKLDPIQNVSIENLKIIRLDSTTAQTSNIYLEYAANCRVKCIESNFCNFSHVELRKSTNVEVSGSYFHDAFNFGGGGKAYGVMLHFSTGACLITQNTFDQLRHAMILQAGANGNVISYNYSVNPFWTDVSLPEDAAGDLVLHGNYPYCNLFEGNTVQNIVIDDSHGINGPFNTFFRNRAEHYGIFMAFLNPSNDQNFLGNEITSEGFPLGNYFLSGSGHFEFGNNKANTIVPVGTEDLQEASLYLDEAPVFYHNNSSWPPIGFPNNLESYTIENEYLFHQNLFSKCNDMLLNTTDLTSHAFTVTLSPNPAHERIQIELDKSQNAYITEVEVIGLNGSIVLKNEFSNVIDLRDLDSGLYFMRIQLSDGMYVNKKFMKF